jgi:hypothetical protein
LSRLTHAVPHSKRSLGQPAVWHCPPTQGWPAAQGRSQPPQCWAFVCVSTHVLRLEPEGESQPGQGTAEQRLCHRPAPGRRPPGACECVESSILHRCLFSRTAAGAA